jgi:hypothetical protein
MIIEISYFIYLIVSIMMTVWVARTLSKNGLIFLIDSFDGNKDLAVSVNHMLVVGFYLLNLGYILLALQTNQNLNTLRDAIEFLSQKIGFVLVVIGILHFFNVYVIAKWRNRALRLKESRFNKSVA